MYTSARAELGQGTPFGSSYRRTVQAGAKLAPLFSGFCTALTGTRQKTLVVPQFAGRFAMGWFG